MAVQAQNELLIKRLQFICNSLVAATQAAKAVPPRGHIYKYDNSMTGVVWMLITTFGHTTTRIVRYEREDKE